MKAKTYAGPYRVHPQPALDFSGELIVDLFAGGGGASTGIEWALGRSPDIAVNHNRKAVLMHQINHPHTKHFCESVFDVVPQEVCGGRPVGYLWMSPDCTHFSKAKGSKPVSKRVRGLAWVGKRWAATVRPRVIFLENVEEFQTWGPLVRINGEMHPCRKRSGRTFRNFVRELQRFGYQVEWRTMRACDYGAPTIRKRLFLVARCDGEPIVWPEPTHAEPGHADVKAGRLLPWRTAAECIDWSIPCPSIFTRKRPLADNTLRRIARGIQRYVIDNPQPFIVPIQHYNGRNPAHSINEPLRTVTAYPKGGSFAVVAPSISTYYGPKGKNHHRGMRLDEPLRTQTTENRFALQAAMLLKHYGGVVGHGINQPAGTITTQDHHAIGAATLVQTGYGERKGQSPRVPHLDKPLGTAMAGGVKHAVSTAHLIRHFGKSVGNGTDEPVATITAGGSGKTGLVTSNLVKLKGTCRDGQKVIAPMPTLCAGGTHIAEVRAFLLKYYGADQDPRIDEPLHTVTTKHRFGLVTVNGVLHQIVDIGMRMLVPRELYRAQGFPDNYIIDHVIDMVQVNGIWAEKIIPLTVTDQVKFVGNSVSPWNAFALVAANSSKNSAAIAA